MDATAAGVLGFCIIVAAVMHAPLPRRSEAGRYQFVCPDGVNCFVLDTRTGRLWQRLIPPPGGPAEWSEDKAPWVEAPAKWSF